MGERTGLKFSLSPFDSARFEALAEGLEVSVMQLSAWQADNDFHRLDSQFQRKSLLAAIGTVCAHGAIQLHDEQLEIIHPHELKREYTEEDAGTWFLRTQNVRPMRLDKANKVFLPTSVADGLPRNRVRADDILMTRTGANRGDCTLFDGSEPAVASSHVFLIRSAGWSPSYLMTFLNTKYGLGQIEKGAYGGAQPELAPYYLQRIWIPAASDRLQSEISRLIHEAREASSSTADQLARAETALLDALGLADWSPPEPLTYSSSASAVVAAERLDPQYFMPAKTLMFEALAALDGRPIGESFRSIRDVIDPTQGDRSRLVRNYDLTDALQPVLDESLAPVPLSDIESQKKRFQDGDLAVSRLRSYLREIAVVRVPDDVPAIGSSEFYVLRRRPKARHISAETMMIYLRAKPVQTMLKWCQDGSQHPRFAERDLLAIPLPEIVADLNDGLTKHVREALDKRARSLALLAAARSAVEIAIEVGEPAAFQFLAQTHTR